jgi:hypothetical protein
MNTHLWQHPAGFCYRLAGLAAIGACLIAGALSQCLAQGSEAVVGKHAIQSGHESVENDLSIGQDRPVQAPAVVRAVAAEVSIKGGQRGAQGAAGIVQAVSGSVVGQPGAGVSKLGFQPGDAFVAGGHGGGVPHGVSALGQQVADQGAQEDPEKGETVRSPWLCFYCHQRFSVVRDGLAGAGVGSLLYQLLSLLCLKWRTWRARTSNANSHGGAAA